MSESVLKALVRLFALIGDIHDETIISGTGKTIVRKFLLRHLSNEQAETYMKMFDEYLAVYRTDDIEKGSIRDRKRISLNSMRILSICEQINSELSQDQKVYVIVKLIDYIAHGNEITETELDFVETVSGSFNIPEVEFLNMKSFIMGSMGELRGNTNLLVVGNSDDKNSDYRYIVNENLRGAIMFLKIVSTNTWLMRYMGDEALYLNGQNIQVGETYIFDRGSSVRGSAIKAIYYPEIAAHFTAASSVTPVVLSAEDINFRFKRSENGVHDLNFTGKSGELVGILGGSGVGKSTTLSILSGTLKPQDGRVLINGYDLYNSEDRETLRGVIGFVPQDDLLIEELTVYQNLYYNARMCLSNLSEEQLNHTVERIITDLDLTGAQDLQVGNPLKKIISGGQRKRINIALELMREPTVLFVDEPTSGLSSVDSEIVMSLLKDLTFKGKLVIVNIHQPSSDIYKMFDRIMIIDRGGYQVFQGNPSEAIIYFRVQTNHANPDEDQCTRCGNVDTEQLLHIIELKVLDEHGKPTRTRKISPSEWAERYRAFFGRSESGEAADKRALPPNRFSIPGKLNQTIIFFVREVLARMADKQYLLISLLGPPVLALVLSFFTRTPAGSDYLFRLNDNIPAYLFMCVITSMFFGLMVSSEEIIRDRKILKRESFLNLSWFSYINSKVLIMFILSAVQTFSFVLAGSLILEIRGMTLSHWLILFSSACFANVLGLNFSSAFRSVITVYILIPFIIIPQLLFSGVMVKFHKLNAGTSEYVPLIGEAMMARWAFEAIAVKQFRDNEYSRLFFDHESEVSRYERYGYLADALLNDLFFIRNNHDNPVYNTKIKEKFRKLDIYTGQLASLTGLPFENGLKESIARKEYSDDFMKKYRLYHDTLKQSIMHRMRIALDTRNNVIGAKEESIGADSLSLLKDHFVNEMLRREMLNLNETMKVIETNDKIILRFEPGYMPGSSGFGRAHFYAPSKTIGSIVAGTYSFNLVFIWLNTVLLYILLYFKVFERVISWLSGVRFGKGQS